jgi:hypothetical protein
MDFPNQQDEIRNTLVLAHEDPWEGFADLVEIDIQEDHDCHAVELIKEDLRAANVQWTRR